MDTILAIISFPFWFLGIVLVVDSLLGDVIVANEKNTPNDKFIDFIFGTAFIVAAWVMVSV